MAESTAEFHSYLADAMARSCMRAFEEHHSEAIRRYAAAPWYQRAYWRARNWVQWQCWYRWRR